MNCNYKVNIKDIQNKYKFNIFAMGGYNDSDLRKMIESVFYALPRTTGTGTSVTLNDTAFSYMKNKLYATETSQKTTTGKNLFNGNAVSTTTSSNWGITFENNVLTIEHKNAYSTGTPKLDLGVLPSGTYVISFVSTYQISLYKNGDYYTVLSSGNTFTANGTDSFYVLLSAPDNASMTYKNVQLELGSTPTDYEQYSGGIPSPNPDYPQVIHTINGDNKIISEGKNLLDYTKNNVSSSTYTINNNRLTITANGNIYLEMPTIIGETYTLTYTKNSGFSTIRASDYNNGGSWIHYGIVTGTGRDHITFTANSNKAIIMMTNGTANSSYIEDLQVKKGSTIEYDFTPYKSNSVLLTLGDKEICKIGNYEDKIFKAIKGNEIYDSLASEEKATLDYGKWYLRKAVGKQVYNGTETWGKATSGGNVYFSTPVEDAIGGYGVISIYSNYFIPKYNNTIDGFFLNNKYIAVYNHGIATETADFKTWLSTHNTSLYYPLETPVNELFNDTIQDQLEDIYNNMLSYEGQTNVSQVNNDLPFNINSTAIKDLNDL